MPQYLAPGVYVEEIAGPRTIEGVGTSTAAFVGPCRYGPTSGRPQLLTSYLEFARIFGDTTGLRLGTTSFPNYVALAAKGFFDEGGTNLYVARVFRYLSAVPTADHAWAGLGGSIPKLVVRARFPGTAGQMLVTFTLRVGRDVRVGTGPATTVSRVREFDTVYATGPGTAGVYVVRRDAATGGWRLAGNVALPVADTTAVLPITVLVEARVPAVDPQGLPAFGPPVTVGEFGFDARAGNGISTTLVASPPSRAQALTVPIALEGIEGLQGPSAAPDDLAPLLAEALLGSTVLDTATRTTFRLDERQASVVLNGGSDGLAPVDGDYRGDSSTFTDYQDEPLDLPQRGLAGLEAVDDVSIVAVPGASTGWAGPQPDLDAAQAIHNAVLAHCERLGYRVAALDVPPGSLPDAALDFRNRRSSDHGSLYYPWIVVTDPVSGVRLPVPPAGYLAGIWARSDIDVGVVKAPANEVIRSAVDLETRLNKAQQSLLNPEGVNCLRFFPGPGFLVWGARTISDDPAWKYLSMRRYFNYLEKSIDEGTQWVVFEVNGPALWDAVRHTVEGFLRTEWKSGALLGSRPEDAYFVRCDATTMTADDLDNGRLICNIGVAVAKPAEFVIFRISQFTASTAG